MSAETDAVWAEWKFNGRNKPADVPIMLALLSHPVEEARYGAAYALGIRQHDARILKPLIRVLTNLEETPRVRGQAAESLRCRRSRKALRALIECSTDPSPEVRFWCVFALGEYPRRRNKIPRPIVQALEARLNDDGQPNWMWTVGLEALAMLGCEQHPARHLFRQKIRAVLCDPLHHESEWQWTLCYWDSKDLFEELKDLFDKAARTVVEAGLDPNRFGHSPPPTARP